ncbi:MAG TPA: hypothetical protein VLM85_10290 [Polyangiaceae bacterium]|nr:hypothetical protein [Polyangiaceae bacterium]
MVTPSTRTWLLAILAGGALLAEGCSATRVSLSSGPREYVSSDYNSVFNRWTRTESLLTLSELDDMLTATATFESWDFRWAYVVRYSSDYRLTVEQRRELLEKTLAETQVKYQFYVALYGTKWKWDDLTKPTSAWIVRLIDEKGNETAPTRIELVKPGPIEFRYFPYTSPLRHCFRIDFPRVSADGKPTISESSTWFGLRFAGAQGNEELRWELEEPEKKTAALGPTTVSFE